jgi:hypothetical protein
VGPSSSTMLWRSSAESRRRAAAAAASGPRRVSATRSVQSNVGSACPPTARTGAVGEDDLLLLADAQTSGGLLVAGELPGAAVIGELVPRRDSALIIR